MLIAYSIHIVPGFVNTFFEKNDLFEKNIPLGRVCFCGPSEGFGWKMLDKFFRKRYDVYVVSGS